MAPQTWVMEDKNSNRIERKTGRMFSKRNPEPAAEIDPEIEMYSWHDSMELSNEHLQYAHVARALSPRLLPTSLSVEW